MIAAFVAAAARRRGVANGDAVALAVCARCGVGVGVGSVDDRGWPASAGDGRRGGGAVALGSNARRPLSSWSAPIVEGAATGFVALQSASGLPWWATIPLATVAARAAMFPLAMAQGRAIAAHATIARHELARLNREREEGADGSDLPPASWGRVMQAWRDRSREVGAPSALAWIAAPMAVQIGAFVTISATLRFMALSGAHGFDSGGLLWFTNLALPAFDYAHVALPMGYVGVVGPMALGALNHYNLRRALVPPDPPSPSPSLSASPSAGAARTALAAKVFVEVWTLPMVLLSCAVPHAVLLHWTASGVFSAIQAHGLQHPYVRTALRSALRRYSGAAPPSKAPKAIDSKALLELDAIAREGGQGGAADGKGEEEEKEEGGGGPAVAEAAQSFVVDADSVSSYAQADRLAHHFLGKEDWVRAHKMFIIAATKAPNAASPEVVRAFVGAALALDGMGRGAEAVELLEQAVSKDPKNVQAMLCIASIQSRAGEEEQASTWLTRAEAVDGRVASAFKGKETDSDPDTPR